MIGVKLGVSSYSYWHFRGPKFPIETVIERAGAMGVQGVEGWPGCVVRVWFRVEVASGCSPYW